MYIHKQPVALHAHAKTISEHWLLLGFQFSLAKLLVILLCCIDLCRVWPNGPSNQVDWTDHSLRHEAY